MRTVVIKPGDHVPALAYAHGVDAKEVWDHQKNEPLRSAGRTPDMLHPGDVLTLPEPPTSTLNLKKGQGNKFKARIPKLKTRIRIADANGAVANEAYVITGLGRQPIEGTTDGDGYLEFEAPVTARLAELRLPRIHHIMTLGLGELDPVSQPSGIRMRLSLLGLYAGPLAGALDDIVSRALRRFQKEHDLEETGEPDDATRDELTRAVGC